MRGIGVLTGIVLLLLFSVSARQMPVDTENDSSGKSRLENQLREACIDGDIEAVKDLLSRGVSPNCRDGALRTPLSIAFGSRRFEIVELLAERGGYLDFAGSLHDLTAKGDLEGIRGLLEGGVRPDNVSATDVQQPAIWFASRASNIELCRLLADYGADMDVADRSGWTALHWACLDRNSEIIPLLIELGADPYAQAARGEYVLEFAVIYGGTELVRPFIDAGVDLNHLYGDAFKRTILDIVNGRIMPFPQDEKYRARLEGSKKLIEQAGGKTSVELGVADSIDFD